jgi:hypothetical protein
VLDQLHKPKLPATALNDPSGAVSGDLDANTLEDPLLTADTLLADPAVDSAPADDPDDPTASTTARVDKRMSRSLFDWRITDEEATDSLKELVDLDDAALDAALLALGKSGKLKRLFEQLPKDVYETHPKQVLHMYRHAPPAVLKAHIQDLLSLGVFDWAIAKGEVHQVLDMLSVLPKAARDEVMLADDGRLYESLMAANKKAEVEGELKANKAAQDKQDLGEQRGPGAFPMADGQVNDPALDLGADGAAPTVAQGEGQKKGFLNKVGRGTAKAFKGIGQGAVGAFVAGRALVSKKVDLDHVEAMMGGDVAGMEIDKAGGNDLSFTTDWDRGLITVDLPSLAIESVKLDGVQSGASKVLGAKGEVKYKTTQDLGSFVKLHVDSVDLGDTSVVMGASTYEIKGLKIRGLDVTATDPPVTQAKPLERGDGVKLVLNQIGDAIGLNLPAIKAALGGSVTPETLMQHVGKGIGADADLNLKVAGIDLTSVVKDGQPMAESVDVDGFELTTRDVSLKPRLEAERAKLAKLPEPTDHDTQRIQELDGLLAGWDAKENRLTDLQARATKGTLNPMEQDALILLRNELRVAEAHLGIDKIHTGKIDVDGNGVAGLDATGVDITASGGDLEAAKRQKTHSQTLDDLVTLKHPGADVEAEQAVPALQVSGEMVSYDVDGASYLSSTYGDLGVSADGTGLGFTYDEASGDVSAKSDTFNVDGLDYGEGASADYADYRTKLNHAQGDALRFGYNLNSGAMTGSANQVVGDGLQLPGYDTKVDSFSASTAGFSMTEAGDIHADAAGVNAGGVDYRAAGNETTLDCVSADTFAVDLFDRTAEDGSTTSTMSGSATNVSASGVGYEPSAVKVGEASADKAAFSMVDHTSADGATTTSTTTANLSGVAATGIDYLDQGNETHVAGATATTLDLNMVDRETGDDGTSTIDVTGTGLDLQGIAYDPSAVGVDQAHADTYAFNMTDNTQAGVTTSTMGGSATGVTAGGVSYADGTAGEVGVDGVKAKSAKFAIDEAGDLTAGAKGVRAKGVHYGQEGTADHVTVGGVSAGTATFGMTDEGDMRFGLGGTTATNITRGVEGASRLEVDQVKTSYLGGAIDDGGAMAFSSPELHASGVRYGDTDHGAGTTVNTATAKDLHVGITDDGTTVNASQVGATDVQNLDSGVGVGTATLDDFALTSDDATTITAGAFNLGGVTYDDAATEAETDASIHAATGKGLSVKTGDGALDVGVTDANLDDIRYGSTAAGETGVHAEGANLSGFTMHQDAAGIDANLAHLELGQTWARTGDRMTTLKHTDVFNTTAEDVKVGGPGTFSGDVNVGTVLASDVRSQEGDNLTNVGTVGVDDLYANGDGDDRLNVGAGGVWADDVRHKQGDSRVKAGTVDVTDVNATLGDLSGEPALDGLSVGSVTATDVAGYSDIWKLLNKKSDPAAANDALPAGVDTPAQGEDTGPGAFRADALAHASGTVTAVVPVSVDLGWAGSIDLDVTLKAAAVDGEVNVNDISIDVESKNLGGWIVNNLTPVGDLEPALTVDGSGNLELYIELDLSMLLPSIPIWINLVEGKDLGMSGGWISPNVINLQGLVEGLMKPKKDEGKPVSLPAGFDPFAQPAVDDAVNDPFDPALQLHHAVDNTYVAPPVNPFAVPAGPEKTTTETVDEKLKTISPYVNTGRASVNLTALKLGDGVIGNDAANAYLYGSDEGANTFDGQFTAGSGGTLSSEKVRARDVNVGDDVSVDDVQLDGVEAKAEKLVGGGNQLNKSQKVGGSIDEARVTGVQVGNKPGGRRVKSK